MFLKIREPFSSLSHFAGAIAAVVGSYLLLSWGGTTPARVIALVIYGLSLFVLFSASGIYHSVTVRPGTLVLFRRIDHSAIYLLIAGTYTPFCVIAFTGFWQWGFLSIIWTLAFIGILVKMFILNTPRWVTAGLYLLMGWLSLFAMGEFLRQESTVTFIWLLTGGVLYTLGAVIYITRKGNFFPGVIGFHEIWHIFVLLAAAAHFLAVASIL